MVRPLLDPSVNSRLPRSVILYSDDAAVSDCLSRVSDGHHLSAVEMRPGGLGAALDDDGKEAEIILIDLQTPSPDQENTELDFAGLSQLSSRPGARVIALGDQNDVRLFHRLRQAGVADYLVHPVGDEELFEALHVPQAVATAVPSETTSGPHTSVVIGCRGGVGATSFAVSAAWWSAEKLMAQTALIDLDLVFGTATLALDLLPGRGLREALENPDRIDPLFIGSAMINATDRLFVLGAEEQAGTETHPTSHGIACLLDAVRDSIPSVFVDLPRALLPVSEDLLRDADEIVLLSDLSLAGLRDAIRVKALCQASASDVQTTLIGVLPPAGPPPVDRREFERAYEGAIDWLVPWDSKHASQTVSDGKPLVSGLKSKHAYSKAIEDVALRSMPAKTDAPQRKRAWLW